VLTRLVGALIVVACTAALLFGLFLVYGLASRLRRPDTADFVVVLAPLPGAVRGLRMVADHHPRPHFAIQSATCAAVSRV
jgi:hypothetical protein